MGCGMAFTPGEGFHSVGGWGFPASDAGSGARLGLSALRESLLVHEGLEPESRLADELIAYFNGQPGSLMKWQYTAQPRDYAAFAPVVFRHSDEGDHLATRLVNELLDEAEMLARGLLKMDEKSMLWPQGPGTWAAPELLKSLKIKLWLRFRSV